MRTRTGTTALAAAIAIGTFALPSRVSAQEAAVKQDSAPRFALFGGYASQRISTHHGYTLGASGDFRWTPIPVPLRLSLSFDEQQPDYASVRRGAQASLDLVLRPIPKRFGIQPYFLGGVGVATQAPYSGVYYGYVNPPEGTANPQYFYSSPRQTWGFASVGMGLNVGRLFVQVKHELPVASQGPSLTPLSVGFRFWD
jgi:hypothetical protein